MRVTCSCNGYASEREHFTSGTKTRGGASSTREVPRCEKLDGVNGRGTPSLIDLLARGMSQ